MYRHKIPLFLPPEFAADPSKGVSMTNKGNSTSEVPRHPRRGPGGRRDAQSKFYDAYFFGQLFSLYQSGEFPRGNLDAGRLNALYELGVLEFSREDCDSTSEWTLYRLNVVRGFEEFGNLGGSPSHGGFDA